MKAIPPEEVIEITDSQIIDLYWNRNEEAIKQTDTKYGHYCRSIATNLLGNKDDVEECVNDTYFQVWMSIPPVRPNDFKSWLGSIIRNVSLNLWNKNHAKKRHSEMGLLLSELEDCIPTSRTIEQEIESAYIASVISTWLRTLPKRDRIIFIQRYWYAEPLKNIASRIGISEGKLAQKMYRLRLSLKTELNKEGIFL